jgi:UDP-2,3-diacylglucosamine hydrolase
LHPAPLPPIQELLAPPGWRVVELISDLHLQAAEPANFEAWRRYMAHTDADAVFILGDLFEAWVGDDAAAEPGFDADCAAVLQAGSRQRPVFFMHGNRDFLVGDGLLASCGVTLLHDPTVFGFLDQRWLLSHGDQLCLDDTAYMRFREMVRAPAWQKDLLAKPLAERRALARAIRDQSEARHRSGQTYAEVDETAAVQWLRAADATTLIHGHTHRPADHVLPGGLRRIVLSDWDAAAQPPRLEALRIDAAGAQRIPIG